MSGKQTTRRQGAPRTVELSVGGQPVALNGYVMDVFQEVVVGLVRALGGENPEQEIRLTIGAQPK